VAVRGRVVVSLGPAYRLDWRLTLPVLMGPYRISFVRMGFAYIDVLMTDMPGAYSMAA